MSESHTSQPTGDELTVVDNFAQLSAEEAAAARRQMAERADRVHRRLTMNQAFVPPVTPPADADRDRT